MSDIVQQLRDRACPAGLAWTADDPKSDHGHTDCWLHNQAADEIERLREEVKRMRYDILLGSEGEAERLRVLITEWADAEDAWGHPSIDRVNTAVSNLRAEVGK